MLNTKFKVNSLLKLKAFFFEEAMYRGSRDGKMNALNIILFVEQASIFFLVFATGHTGQRYTIFPHLHWVDLVDSFLAYNSLSFGPFCTTSKTQTTKCEPRLKFIMHFNSYGNSLEKFLHYTTLQQGQILYFSTFSCC